MLEAKALSKSYCVQLTVDRFSFDPSGVRHMITLKSSPILNAPGTTYGDLKREESCFPL
jgi:hypothetical protein